MSGWWPSRLGKLADLLHEAQRLAEVAELELALNAVRVVAQLPVRDLAVKAFGLLCGESGGIPPLQGVQVFAASVSSHDLAL